MRRMRWACAFTLLVLSQVAAGARPYTPPPGSSERKALMDTLRVPVQRELRRGVIFQVEKLKVENGWAFMEGIPLQPNGNPMNYRGTSYQEAAAEGSAFGGGIDALLRKRAGQWRVVTYVIGASDVTYWDWDKRYGAPSAIFGLHK